MLKVYRLYVRDHGFEKVSLFIMVIFYGFQSYRDERMRVGHQEGSLWIAAGVGGQGTGKGGTGVPKLP